MRGARCLQEGAGLCVVICTSHSAFRVIRLDTSRILPVSFSWLPPHDAHSSKVITVTGFMTLTCYSPNCPNIPLPQPLAPPQHEPSSSLLLSDQPPVPSPPCSPHPSTSRGTRSYAATSKVMSPSNVRFSCISTFCVYGFSRRTGRCIIRSLNSFHSI
jgi:hypothetical protein